MHFWPWNNDHQVRWSSGFLSCIVKLFFQVNVLICRVLESFQTPGKRNCNMHQKHKKDDLTNFPTEHNTFFFFKKIKISQNWFPGNIIFQHMRLNKCCCKPVCCHDFQHHKSISSHGDGNSRTFITLNQLQFQAS